MHQLHPEVIQLLEKIAAAQRPAFADSTPDELRKYQAKTRLAKGSGPNILSVEDVFASIPSGELPVRLFHPTATPGGLILYFHGGGWTVGSVDYSDTTCRKLALASGCLVASVEYRLAPEHPFPAAYEDALAALAWAAEVRASLLDRTDAALIIMGESAGGNIALAALLDAACLLGEAALLILAYPVVDCDLDTSSYREFADGALLTRRDMAWFWDNYCPDIALRTDPRLSPLRSENLSRLPRTVVVSAACDPLFSEGAALVEHLEAARVQVQHLVYPGVVHGFFGMSDDLSQGRQAIADVAQVIRDVLGQTE